MVAQIPAHNHLVNAASSDNRTSSPPNGQYLASTCANSIYNSNPDSMMNPNMIQLVGGNQAYTIVQPFPCVNSMTLCGACFRAGAKIAMPYDYRSH